MRFSAVAAIFVQDPAVLPLLPGEAFGKPYGLTGGELRVALKVASGFAPQETAETLGIGLETVKTHLQHIFQKTGTTRQAELVALASRCAGLLNVSTCRRVFGYPIWPLMRKPIKPHAQALHGVDA